MNPVSVFQEKNETELACEIPRHTDLLTEGDHHQWKYLFRFWLLLRFLWRRLEPITGENLEAQSATPDFFQRFATFFLNIV